MKDNSTWPLKLTVEGREDLVGVAVKNSKKIDGINALAILEGVTEGLSPAHSTESHWRLNSTRREWKVEWNVMQLMVKHMPVI